MENVLFDEQTINANVQYALSVISENVDKDGNLIVPEPASMDETTKLFAKMVGNPQKSFADIAHKDGTLKASKRSAQKSAPETALETALESASETALQIIDEIRNNPNITLSEIAENLGVSRRWIATNVKFLQNKGIVKRIGPNKGGHWEIIG